MYYLLRNFSVEQSFLLPQDFCFGNATPHFLNDVGYKNENWFHTHTQEHAKVLEAFGCDICDRPLYVIVTFYA